jgi:hypothetical protein
MSLDVSTRDELPKFVGISFSIFIIFIILPACTVEKFLICDCMFVVVR